MTDTLFPDISEYQPNADLSGIRKQTGAIAARILYGTTPDKTIVKGRIGAIRAQKFDAVMYYVFMRASTVTAVSQQAAAVKQLLPELLPGEAICVDWETDPNKVLPSKYDRDNLLTMLDNIYGQRTVLYGSASSLVGYAGARPVWCASYGTREPTIQHQIWQYTDGIYTSSGYAPVSWPGAGKCDTSVFHGTSQQLAAILSPKFGQQVSHMQLNKPIVGIVLTKSGGGYWMVAADGGVFAFGDATSFSDPLPAQPLAAPIVGAVSSPTDRGLTLVGADGGVFCIGDAQFRGSIPGLPG